MNDDKYEIMREISKNEAEKAALEAANEKAKRDFAKELLEESPTMYGFPCAFTIKKPLKMRLREKRNRIMDRIKSVFGL